MPNSPTIDRNSPTALHRQIYEHLKRAISCGNLAPGARLLPSRELARQFGVSRNTLMNALDRLVLDGYLVARVGSGTFVKRRRAYAQIVHPASVGTALPSRRSRLIAQGATHVVKALNVRHCDGALCPLAFDRDSFPFADWKKTLRGALASQKWDPQRIDAAGYVPLRQAILDLIAQTRGIHATVDQVFLFDGTQSALSAIAAVLFDEGDLTAVEDPGFPGAYSAFESAGITVVPFTPFTGSDVEPIRRLSALGQRVRGCFVTPTHQMPLGTAIQKAGRLGLIDWAVTSGAWIVEDDFGCEFHYGGEAIPALQSLDRHGHVVHIGTFSNTLGPLLRLAYVVVPAGLVHAFGAVRAVSTKITIDAGHIALSEMLQSGRFRLYLRRRTKAFRANRDALLAEFAKLPPEVEIADSGYGLYISLLFDESFARDTELVQVARQHDVCVRPLSTFCRASRRNGIIVGFTSESLAATMSAARSLVSVFLKNGAP